MQWLWGIAAVVVLLVLLLRLSPSLGGELITRTRLEDRSPLPDREMLSRYFADVAIAPDIPCRVRTAFAKYLVVEADRLLPDDDLDSLWAHLDMSELIDDLESQFGIVITDDEAERTDCTIRAVAMLIANKQGNIC